MLAPSAAFAEPTSMFARFSMPSGPSGALRPIAPAGGWAVAIEEDGGDVAIDDRFSFDLYGAHRGTASSPLGGGSAFSTGLHFKAFSTSGTDVLVGFGALGELSGARGMWTSALASTRFGRLRLRAAARGEHVFSAGRDPLDVVVTASASVRVSSSVLAGVEYVGQDLEAATDPAEAEGGALQLAGPIVAYEASDGGLTILGGPAWAVLDGRSRAIGRLGVAYRF